MTNETPQIVLIEDNASDVFLLREAFHRAGLVCDLVHLNNGERALEWFFGASTEPRRPSLVILDLNLPRLDGMEVLRALRFDQTYQYVPAVIFTSSDSPADRDSAYALGIAAYIVKPLDLEEFMQIGIAIRDLCATLEESGSG